jgi:cytidylate kinase
MVDTGLYFRLLAKSASTGGPQPLAADVLNATSHPDEALSRPDIRSRAASLAADPEARREFSDFVRGMVASLDRCILVGRDSWKFIGEDAIRVRVEASDETRARRHVLALAKDQKILVGFHEALEILRAKDHAETERLPPLTLPGLVVLTNDRRSLERSYSDLVNRLREVP